MRMEDVKPGEMYVIAPPGRRPGAVPPSACWQVRVIGVAPRWPDGRALIDVQPVCSPQDAVGRHRISFPGMRRRAIPASTLTATLTDAQAAWRSTEAKMRRATHTLHADEQAWRHAAQRLSEESGCPVLARDGRRVQVRADDPERLADWLEENEIGLVDVEIHAAT